MYSDTTDWQGVLGEIEATAGAMITELDTRQQALDASDDVDSAGELRKAHTRVAARLQRLGERIARAEQSAHDVGAELAAAESEFRDWHAQVRQLQDRLASFVG